MASVASPRPATKSSRKPLAVELVMTINGQAYEVEPIAVAPAGVRSFRLAKCSGDGATYDLDAFADRVECSCPSYQKTHAGTSSPCKHGRALIMVGLIDYPSEASEPAPAAEPMASPAAIVEAEAPARVVP